MLMTAQHPQLAGITRRTVLYGLAGGTTLLVAGCSFQGDSDKSASKGKTSPKTLRVGVGVELDSMDPHVINNARNYLPCGVLECLVSQNDAGTDVVPAIAEKWSVSADALVYTFTIRSSAKYSNGDPITAADIEKTFKRLLTPTGAGGGGADNANSYPVGLGIKNAEAFLSGAISDWSQVGIKVTDKKTIVLTVDTPNPDFLYGLTDPAMVILNPASIAKFPKTWTSPANFVSSGPFKVESWTAPTAMTLVPNEHYWDRGNIKLDKVDMRAVVDAQAALLAYKNNEIDVVMSDLTTLISTDAAMMAERATADGYFIAFLNLQYSKHPASRDLRVRQALSLALNREQLAKINPGSTPSSSLVPKETPGWTTAMATSVFDIDKAKRLLVEAGYPGGQGMPTVQLYNNSSQPVCDAIVEMWKRIGVKAIQNVVDPGIWSEARWKIIEDPNTMGFYYNTYGGPKTMNNWVYTLWGPDTQKQFSLSPDSWGKYQKVQADSKLSAEAKGKQLADILEKLSTPEARAFSDLANKARITPNDTKRLGMYIEAAKLREQLCEQIPVAEQPIAYLVRPKVTGVHVRPSVEGIYFKGVALKA